MEKSIKTQFGIAFLLATIAIASLALSVWSNVLERQRRIDEAVPWIAQMGGDNNENPVSIILAYNEIQPLGANDALAALRQFDRLDSSRDFEAMANVSTLAHLLFDQNELIRGFMDSKTNTSNGEERAPHFVIVEGVPFATNILHHDYAASVPRYAPSIAWAEKQTNFAKSDLRPTDNPFAACEKLIPHLIQWKKREYEDCGWSDSFESQVPERTENRLKEQVYQMVQHLVSDMKHPRNKWSKNTQLWESIKLRCLRDGIHWDNKTNCYSFSK